MSRSHRIRLSGEKISVTYHLDRSSDQVEDAARDICIEQTVEFPEDLIGDEEIRSLFGQIRSLRPISIHVPGTSIHVPGTSIEAGGRSGAFEIIIEFPVEAAGIELTQLVNLLFGNISLKPGISLRSFELPPSLTSAFRGPRFGRGGLRDLLGVPDRPLLATALKPMGMAPSELADQAYRFALGGMDLIKDDHGLADQVFCPFEERVSRCAEAVRKANASTGGRCLYLPNVTAPAETLLERARFAGEAGAGGLVISPGLVGLDAMRALADDDRIGLPLMSHPAFQGSLVVGSPRSGVAHGAIFGQLARLAGADAVIFPSFGGRFSFTHDECLDLVDGTERHMGGVASCMPAPAGGKSLTKVPEMLDFYGRDVILLIGGDLHRHGDLVRACRAFAALVS